MIDYVISYLFIFIALFLIFTIVGKIALKKLINLDLNKPWQRVLFVSLLFFFPVKQSLNSTSVFQDSWKFFVDENKKIK